MPARPCATAKSTPSNHSEALLVLKNFYKQAAKAAFVQTGASPVDEDAPEVAIEELIEQVLRDADRPWRCLGVSQNPSDAELRKRYLYLVRRLHPDKQAHPRAAEAFAAVESAYEQA